MKIVRFFLLVIILFPIILYGQNLREEQRRLEEIRDELKQMRARRNKARKEEKSALQKLQETEQELELIQLLLKELNRKAERTQERIEQTEEELETIQQKLAEQQELMGLRLREIYKFYQINEFEAFLTAESFADLIEKQRYMELLAVQDQELYEEIEANKARIERKKERLEQIIVTLNELQEEQIAEKEKALTEKTKKEAVLNDVRTQKAEAEKAIKDLERAQEEVQNIINRLESARKRRLAGKPNLPKSTGNHYLDKNKGRVLWPVSGKVITKFGLHKHPVFRTQTFNKGINIAADKGTPIKSIDDGNVVYVSWFRGYGKYVIIDHGEGYYSLYAHCSDILVQVGEKISRGQVIAHVGDTGSLVGNALHFELRKNGEPIDPLLYLKK